MRNLILLAVLALGIVAGWIAGSWSGREANVALAKVEETGRQLEIQHKKQVGDLNARISALVSDYQSRKQALDEVHARQISQIDTVLVGTKGQIAELERARTTNLATIKQLKNQRAMESSSATKEKMDGAIAEREAMEGELSIAIGSRRCLELSVPPDVLTSWNGKQP